MPISCFPGWLGCEAMPFGSRFATMLRVSGSRSARGRWSEQRAEGAEPPVLSRALTCSDPPTARLSSGETAPCPGPECSELPTKVRFDLLVFRRKADGRQRS